MRVTVHCKNHDGARVRLLNGTVKFRDWNDRYVEEESEEACTVEIDEYNLYCDGDITKAGHDFAYTIVT